MKTSHVRKTKSAAAEKRGDGGSDFGDENRNFAAKTIRPMIPYRRHTLRNGLRVAVNRDPLSKLAAVNLLYCVGARDENPERTGFAHLFEHLMFRGTRQVPDFDGPVQLACGENNAFTNNDYTDFYITLPKDNIETALWLGERPHDRTDPYARDDGDREAGGDRGVPPALPQPALRRPAAAAPRAGLHAPPLSLGDHRPHPRACRAGHRKEVTDFYRRYYRPSNAILTLSADLEEERMIELCEKWFGDLPDDGTFRRDPLPAEPEQTAARRLTVERPVPATSLTVAYPMGPRLSPDFFAGDLVSDLLAGGESARLYDELVRRRQTLLVGQCLHHRERRRRPLHPHGPVAGEGRPKRRPRKRCWRQPHGSATRPESPLRTGEGKEQVRSQHPVRRS